MTRLMASIKTDFKVQFRNRLYAIGIGVGLIIAVALSQLAEPSQMSFLVPVLMLIVIGGSTMMYVAGMVIFERDEGTLSAVIVSPLRPFEYLGSKVVTLCVLSTLESLVMVWSATLLMPGSLESGWPNLPLLLTGIVGLGVMYTLLGIVLIVRYEKITDFLLPMAGIAVVLQLPFLHFLGMVVHPLLLVIPTSAPTLLIQGAYEPLAVWEWFYGVSYTVASIVLLATWASRAFNKHVVQRAEWRP